MWSQILFATYFPAVYSTESFHFHSSRHPYLKIDRAMSVCYKNITYSYHRPEGD